MNRTELRTIAAKITLSVIENGRVKAGNPASFWAEVEWEAQDRGYDNSEEIADCALDMWAPNMESK